MPRAKQPPQDGEEALLEAFLAACRDKVTAAREALIDPNHSMLMPEYRKLGIDLEMARAECAKATAALKEYQKRRQGQAGEKSK